MGHILYGSVARIATSDEDYYPAAAQVGRRVNAQAARGDVTAVIGTEAGMGAPACFIPSLAEMHINTEAVDLGRVDLIDFTDALWRLEHAPAVGACDHEAAHARHTKWDPRELMEEFGATRKMIDVITTLEEPRIEAQALRFHPASKPFLRGCAMEIVGKDFVISDTRYGAAVAAGLLLARVDAKVLTRAEAATFRKDILAVLGEDTLNTLEAIWQNHLRLRDDDFEAMVVNAHDWLAALGEDPEDDSDLAGESMMGEPLPGGEPGKGDGKGEPGEGEGGEGEGDGEGENPAKGFGKSISGKVARAETKMDGEIVSARGDERAERRRAEREADAARHKDAEAMHEEAFGPISHGYTPEGFAHLTGTREPNADERRAARKLANALERIDYRDRAVTKVASVLPPGRLRGRMAVQQEAARERGQHDEVAVWVGKRRKRVESTPLTIGFATDISGSMSSAMQPLASTQWVVSTAGNHIDASVASVHFGDTVHGVTPKGVREKSVRVFYPGDGSEYFRGAALALDKELNLLDGRGARVLFIASDGHFVCREDADYADRFIPLAIRKGVAVIFLNFTGHVQRHGASMVIDCQRKTPSEVATLCGKAAIAEVRRLDGKV